MSVFRKPGPYPFWIALALASNLTACNNNTATPGPGRHPANGYSMNPTVTAIDVAKVDLGTGVNPDATISNPSTKFKPTDPVYVAVTTERPGHGVVLKARWSFQDGSVIKEVTKTVDASDTLVTDFQVGNDAGWPTGRYKVEIFVNGQKAAVTEFTVNP